MLVSFSVANFRSIGEEVTLNMVASNKLTAHANHLIPIGDTGKSVLRAAVIYGANAAGKSNLIGAMSIAQRLIRESSENRIAVVPFRFSAEPERPSSFEFRFLIGDRVFTYGFDVLVTRFTAEWLTVSKRGDDEDCVFERDEKGAIDLPPGGKRLFPKEDNTFDTLEKLKQLPLKDDQLFLNRALAIPEAVQGDTLRSILNWFTEVLVVLPADSRSTAILDRLYDDSRFRDFCSGFLGNVGTGVGGLDFAVRERESNEWERRWIAEGAKVPRRFAIDRDVIPKSDNPGVVLERRLLSEHHVSGSKYPLTFSQESDGTQSLLHLMPILATTQHQSRVVVLDELDRSLHPLVCWEFVRFFSESCEGLRRQLIVTTHEVHLLNQELLRRDEYWFLEKDEHQKTRLFSLDDFPIRNDLKVEKGYLSGRFGAVPSISGMYELEMLLNCGSEATDAAQAPPT